MPPKVLLTLLAIILFAISPYRAVHGQARSRAERTFPPLRLDQPVRGAAVIDALGSRLPELALWYGKSVEDLDGILRTDTDVWADASGHLFSICEFGALPTEPAEVTSRLVRSAGASVASTLLDQTFSLHSRPGSSKVIYLDFNGHETTGTLWNQLAGRQTIITPSFDTDGNPADFSAVELQRIQSIWARVVEDFAPFDVDVTTQEPTPEALRRDSVSDPAFGVRIVIGGSSLDWYGQAVGGASYIGSFTWDSDTPGFVFEEQLANGNEKYTAEAASHEAGHTLGLFHDGQTNGSAYYAGHGSWAPIMGMSYNKEVTQWSKGDYNQANNTEDDLSVIQNSGLKYRNDDHGDQPGTATRLTGTQLFATGIIERSSDVDVFTFSTGAGQINLNLAVVNGGPNLDVAATLTDASGAVIATSNSPGLGTALSLFVPAGTYYLRVDGVGSGDAIVGYTDYDSLGQYTLTGTVVEASAAPPVARASANPTTGNAPLVVTFSSAGSNDPDGSITDYQWSFGDGSTSAGLNPVYTYFREGRYTATLTVTDRQGLSARESVTIVVGQPINQLPTANASATPRRGSAPLKVNFSSAGSYDPEGPIASYQWSFGNGAISSDANPSLTYTVAGLYTAVLTVMDGSGAKTTSSVVVEVTAPAVQGPVVYIADIDMKLRPTRSRAPAGRVAEAVVTINDSERGRHAGAIVTGTWAGGTTETVTGVTDPSGRVTFTSRASRGNGFEFVVTRVSAAGFTYDPSRNATTHQSVAFE